MSRYAVDKSQLHKRVGPRIKGDMKASPGGTGKGRKKEAGQEMRDKQGKIFILN